MALKQYKKDVPFTVYLGLISFLGFLLIFLNAAFGLNFIEWQSTLLMAVMGIALLIAGGVFQLFDYFKDGRINNIEAARILTVVVGVIALISSVLLAPQLQLNVPFSLTAQIVVSLFAMVLIGIETFNQWRKR